MSFDYDTQGALLLDARSNLAQADSMRGVAQMTGRELDLATQHAYLDAASAAIAQAKAIAPVPSTKRISMNAQLQSALQNLEAAYGTFVTLARAEAGVAAGPTLQLPPEGTDPSTFHPPWDANGIVMDDWWYVGYLGAQKGANSHDWNLSKMALSMTGWAPHTYVQRPSAAGQSYNEAMALASSLGWATVATVAADPAWGRNFPILLPGGAEAAAKAAAEAAAMWAQHNAGIIEQQQAAARGG